MNTQAAPRLAGIHRLTRPVTGLARSRRWNQTRPGHRAQIEFAGQRQLMGYVLAHPDGGMPLGLRLDTERARATAGLGYPGLGVPGGEPMEHPDGNEIGFCTHQDHTGLDPDAVTAVSDPREDGGGRRGQAAARSSRGIR